MCWARIFSTYPPLKVSAHRLLQASISVTFTGQGDCFNHQMSGTTQVFILTKFSTKQNSCDRTAIFVNISRENLWLGVG
jgi:hypothetical protein